MDPRKTMKHKMKTEVDMPPQKVAKAKNKSEILVSAPEKDTSKDNTES